MRLAGLGAIAALGAMLAMPALAQTTTTTPTTPAARPPMTATPPATMPSAMPPATRPMPSATAPTTPSAGMATTAPGKTTAKPMAAPVNINTATAAELDKVKYIGAKRAAKIIAGRPWTSPDDIVAKKIMPKSVYDKIKDRLVAN